jgi:microcin C transport system permease protein
LGYGLPKDYPSWGELIKQGTENMDAYWVVTSVVTAMVVVLFLINSVGEAMREAFDPKKISRYE